MSLWNPLTVFSRPAAPGPSSDHDLTWPGDPLRSSPGRPGVGYGQSYVGRTTVHDRPRNPIGFAPPREPEREQPTRYRTEISFRRHSEAPRASAVSDPTGGIQPAWRTPDVEAAPVDEAPAQVSFEELPATEGVVPFYRREISFRRKKVVEEVPLEESSEHVDDAVAEAAVETRAVSLVEPEADSDAETLPVDDAEPVLIDDAEPVTVVAAQKRRFFGRRKAVEEAAAAEEQDLPVAEAEVLPAAEVLPLPEVVAEPEVETEAAEVEPDAPKAIPFYKRELTFRRKAEAPVADVASPEAADDDVAALHDEPVDVPVQAVVLASVVDEHDFDTTPSFEPEPVPAEALDTAAIVLPVVEDAPAVVEAETADEPAIVADAAPADEADHADDTQEPTQELPVAGVDEAQVEAPASNGRFSRKAKPPKEKASKRKGSQPGRNRKVVGLKIGASQIAAAVVHTTEAGHELLGLARRPLAEGIVVDGDVRDELALGNALKAFFEEEKLPKSDVRVGLSSNRIGVRTIEMEGIEDPERFDNAVRFKAHEVLPVALNESMLDYRVVGTRVDDNGQELRRVLLVVAPRDQVEPYQRVAERAGIRLAGADLEALALLRAFVDPPVGGILDGSATATVAVAIGHESSTLLVAGGGACEFTRVFDWGGSELEDSIATALDVRPVEAAMILRHLSLSGPGRQYETLDEVNRAKATEAVRQRLTPFARELVNSLQFYQTQSDSLGIGRILITGGTSHLEGLDAALHQMIGVDVSVGDPFARVIRADEYNPAIEATIGSMAVPIGLAIDEEAARGVNLLPKVSSKSTRDTRATLAKVAVPVAIALPFAVIALAYNGAHGTVSDRQAELDAIKVQIDALPKPVKPVLETGVVGDEAARATAVANLLGGRVAWDGVFRDLARVLPENVWLTSLSVSQPGADGLATAASAPKPLPGQGEVTPTAVSIEGYTYTQPDVALLLARLATLPSLQRVTLNSSASELVGEKPAVHFVIVADLSQPGGAS